MTNSSFMRVRAAADSTATMTFHNRTDVFPSPVHGWGVFAREPLHVGDVVERAVYLLMPVEEWETGSSLGSYVFEFDEAHVALVLGSVSLYNHSSQPNAIVWFDAAEGVAYVECIREVAPGDELFIAYSVGGDVSAWGIDDAVS